MEHIKDFFGGLDYSVLYIIIGALIAITFHEVSHGFIAYKLGDRTAHGKGRLTLNPIRHIDIMGLLMMVFFRFGWAKPVPVDMRNFKNPKLGMALTALAGPASNLVLAFAAMLLRAASLFIFLKYNLKFCSVLTEFFGILATLSIGLGLFNLIPIPPLDGSKILYSVLPDTWYYFILKYERFSMIALIAVLYFGLLDTYLYTALDAVAKAFWHAASLLFPMF